VPDAGTPNNRLAPFAGDVLRGIIVNPFICKPHHQGGYSWRLNAGMCIVLVTGLSHKPGLRECLASAKVEVPLVLLSLKSATGQMLSGKCRVEKRNDQRQ